MKVFITLLVCAVNVGCNSENCKHYKTTYDYVNSKEGLIVFELDSANILSSHLDNNFQKLYVFRFYTKDTILFELQDYKSKSVIERMKLIPSAKGKVKKVTVSDSLGNNYTEKRCKRKILKEIPY